MTFLRSLRSSEVVIGLAVLLCFIVIGWLDYHRQVRAVEKFDTFSSFDYQSGGYHAWYDLLRREGVRVHRYQRRPAYLNDAVTTLILANNRFDAVLRAQVSEPYGVFTEGDLAALRKWVTSGGRLVWLVDESMPMDMLTGGSGRAIRKKLGIDAGPNLGLPIVTSSGPLKDAAVAITPSPITDGVRSVSGSSRLRIPFDNAFGITPLIADDTGSVIGWYRLGKGSIIVVTDESLFANGRLGQADNARLAYNLAAQGLRPGDAVAFEEWSHGYQTGDTWWMILPWTLRVAVAIAGGALLLLLLGATLRFGPAARLPENVERTSEEYLVSMAALLKRGGATRKAVRDLARLTLHDAARSVGVSDATPASAIASRLRGNDAGDQRANDVIALERLAGYEQPSPAELVAAARLCVTLRKDFALDGQRRIEPRRATQRRSA